MAKRAKAYKKGVRFEYTVRDYLADMGFLVLRCARSRGTRRGMPGYDLVAISKLGRVFLIECKARPDARPDPQAEQVAKEHSCEYIVVTPHNIVQFLEEMRKRVSG